MEVRKLLVLLLIISFNLNSQEEKAKGKNTVIANKIFIQDNVQRVIYDYTQSDEMGLIKMHAPSGWSEPIIKAQFEIRGIVLKGLLGLEFKDDVQQISSGDGFVIPKNTVVRIFNAGKDELILIEVLRPAYKKQMVQEINKF